MIQKFNLVPLLLLFLYLTPSFVLAQDTDRRSRQTINVYLDCRGCSSSFIRSEIDYVNFVRDQDVAEVHLLITLQRTGSGGWEHTLDFMAPGHSPDEDHTIVFISPQSDTNDMMRRRLVNHVELGLIHFLRDRGVFSDLKVDFTGTISEDEEDLEVSDPWNSWTFEIGLSTSFSGEQSRDNFRLGGNFDARRITDEWKIDFSYRQNYNRRTFRTDADDGTTDTDVFTTENQNFTSLIAKSLGDHWTVGGYSRIRSSTQNNIDLSIGATPSIEYSLFPYNEFNQREITLRYGILGSQYNYSEITILNVKEEFLWRNELTFRADFTQPWGGVYGWGDAGAYMHDLSKNRLNMGVRVNMRIVKGLSVFFSGRYSLINDQISLPAGELTEEERLLNLKQQATSYNYGGSIGFEFNFGSIYNNVVNPRF